MIGVRYLQFLNYSCHLSVVCHLTVLIPVLLRGIHSQAVDVSAEDARDKDTGPNLLLEVPFDF